ncbi:MAG TPA: methylated-DNA--[protein]-cysteine S-methyltransferase [Gammaproteobacteria bacterium]|nr:methylated-DNA--[protein]-cysteine S-methyltransferase [Gammaproteobacteria bacterium]
MSDLAGYQAIIAAPFANLGLRLRRDKVCGIDFIFSEVKTPVLQSEFAEYVAEQIGLYILDPQHKFDLVVDVEGTIFQKSVWSQMQSIACGCRLSYGALAGRLNSSARAVGNACRKNPTPLLIPCHRVVAKNGLGGFAGETSGLLLDVKKWLLAHESRVAG